MSSPLNPGTCAQRALVRVSPMPRWPDGGSRSRASHVIASTHSALGDRSVRAIDHGDDALAQGAVDDLGLKCVACLGDPGRAS